MKRLFSFAALMVACSFSFATVRTLSNMTPNPGQYSTFDDAHNASSDGDTIYVHGSSISYGTIFITKQLVIIGTGHNPVKQNPLVSTFDDININTNNVQLIGLRMRSVVADQRLNCSVKKCRIVGANGFYPMYLAGVANWLIEGNIIETADFVPCIYFANSPSDGTIIQNNVFLDAYYKLTQLINNASQRTYILNNVFLGHTPTNGTFFNVYYCNVDNNIFYSSIPDGGNIFNSLFTKNISFASTNDLISQPGLDNVIADPSFTSYTGAEMMFNYAWDLSLQPTSVGIDYGTDGTDCGVYGGLTPRFIETGEPSIAEITAFTITSPTTIPPGGTLTISVTSKRVP